MLRMVAPTLAPTPSTTDPDAAQRQQGLMVGLWVPAEAAAALALPGGEPPGELHVTLAHCGDVGDFSDAILLAVGRAVMAWAAATPPLPLRIRGVGRFGATAASDDQDVFYAAVDAAALVAPRAALVAALAQAGAPASMKFPFTPHITLAYIAPGATVPAADIPRPVIPVPSVRLCLGPVRLDFPLTGTPAGVTPVQQSLLEERVAVSYLPGDLFNTRDFYDPDQPRAANGEWGSGGGEASTVTSEPAPRERPMSAMDERSYAAHLDRMPPEVKEAVANYSDLGFRTWNAQLREHDGDPGPHAASIALLDRALKSGTADTTTVYRSIGSQFGEHNALTDQDWHALVGKTWTDPGYQSAYIDKREGNYPAMMRITVDPGVPGAAIHSLSKFAGEREFLLGRGVPLHITGATKTPEGNWLIDAHATEPARAHHGADFGSEDQPRDEHGRYASTSGAAAAEAARATAHNPPAGPPDVPTITRNAAAWDHVWSHSLMGTDLDAMARAPLYDAITHGMGNHLFPNARPEGESAKGFTGYRPIITDPHGTTIWTAPGEAYPTHDSAGSHAARELQAAIVDLRIARPSAGWRTGTDFALPVLPSERVTFLYTPETAPPNVRTQLGKFPKQLQQWAAIWNSTYTAARKAGLSETDAEGKAYATANGVLKREGHGIAAHERDDPFRLSADSAPALGCDYSKMGQVAPAVGRQVREEAPMAREVRFGTGPGRGAPVVPATVGTPSTAPVFQNIPECDEDDPDYDPDDPRCDEDYFAAAGKPFPGAHPPFTASTGPPPTLMSRAQREATLQAGIARLHGLATTNGVPTSATTGPLSVPPGTEYPRFAAPVTKTEDGRHFPAAAYAYVPDPETPSTWKLRLWADPGGPADPGIVGAAAAALGKGYRGNTVDLPAGDRAAVVAKVRAAWKAANPDKDPDEMPEGIHMSTGGGSAASRLWTRFAALGRSLFEGGGVERGSAVDEMPLTTGGSGEPDQDDLYRSVEDNESYPREAFAYAPTDDPRSWRVRMWDRNGDGALGESRASVDRAINQMVEGFNATAGARALEIPRDDVPLVQARLRAAWLRTHPEKDPDDIPDAVVSATTLGSQFTAQFTATFAGGKPIGALMDRDGTPMVLRPGKIFQAGEYPDKGFSLTAAEMAEMARTFTPAPIDLSHVPTVLDGKLGRLEAVEVGQDGHSLFGLVALPQWLDDLLDDGERKVSASFDRITKRLVGLALVIKPRVEDAALFNAYARFAATATMPTPLALQAQHDTAAACGATCRVSDRLAARFAEPSPAQVAHDEAVKAGAFCSGKATAAHASAKPTDDDEDDAAATPVPTAAPVTPPPAQAPAPAPQEQQPPPPIAPAQTAGQPPPAQAPRKKAAMGTGGGAPEPMEGGRDYPLVPRAMYSHTAQPQYSVAGGAPAERKSPMTSMRDLLNRWTSAGAAPDATLEDLVGPTQEAVQFEASLAAERQARAAVDQERRRLAQQNADLQIAGIRERAANFARNLLRENKITPAEEGNLVEAYVQAGLDDLESGPATFMDSSGVQQRVPRTARIEALFAARPSHMLTEEQLIPVARAILTNQPVTAGAQRQENVPATPERLKSMIESTSRGRALMEEGRTNGHQN